MAGQARKIKTPQLDCDVLLNIVEETSTPTYVYDANVIQRQCRALFTHFNEIPFRLLYAMKANPHPAVLKIMLAEGVGLDVVSPAELKLALQVGFSPGDILYSANNMDDDEMHLAAASGAIMNIGELSRLEKLGRAYPGTSVSIRMNPDLGAGHHQHVVTAGKETKFGIPIAQVRDINQIASDHQLKIVGLHQHIGSGIPDIRSLHDSMLVLLETASHFPSVTFLNFGGGFNIPYRPDQAPLDLENTQQMILPLLQDFAQQWRGKALTFWFEPGRYLVAESGVLLVRVNTLKEANGRTFAGTDSGMGHLPRPVMYGAYHAVYNLSNPDGPLMNYDIVGNICESGDVFARDRAVQEIKEGDVLAILDTGAYAMAMASVYNLRSLPAEVLIDSEGSWRQISRRKSPDELLATYFDYPA